MDFIVTKQLTFTNIQSKIYSGFIGVYDAVDIEKVLNDGKTVGDIILELSKDIVHNRVTHIKDEHCYLHPQILNLYWRQRSYRSRQPKVPLVTDITHPEYIRWHNTFCSIWGFDTNEIMEYIHIGNYLEYVGNSSTGQFREDSEIIRVLKDNPDVSVLLETDRAEMIIDSTHSLVTQHDGNSMRLKLYT